MTQISTRTTDAIAIEINSIKDQTRQIMLQSSIEIGRRLVEAKEMLPHGEWGTWLKESVDYSQSTANNLMKIFEQYGADQLSLFGENAKSQTFANLSYSQAVALLGIPSDEREEFAKEIGAEEMSARELQKAVKEKQELERQLKEAEKVAAQERKAREVLEKQKKDHENVVNTLRSDLEKAKHAGSDDEVERLQAELDDAKESMAKLQDRAKKLESELKKKPIDVPVKEIVVQVPEEIERELEELRKKAASNNEPAIKFKIHFDGLVNHFRELLSSLDSIDEGSRDKYKTAVRGLIQKMTERL